MPVETRILIDFACIAIIYAIVCYTFYGPSGGWR